MNTAEFKDSPLGPIPQDWEVKRLGEIAPLQRGFDLPTKDLQDGPFPVVYSNGICNYHVEAMCDAPGLVTGRSGTIGHFTFIESGRYWPHNTALWVTSFKGNDPLYIKYLYETLHFENFATGSGVPTLNRNAIHEFEVALPSKIDEQQRIAEALGEVDKLIESLDAQIEKKRRIAQGLAHDLLGMRNEECGMRNEECGMRNEPIRRFPGFKGEWERKALDSVIDFVTAPIATSKIDVEKYISTDNMVPNLGGVEPNASAVPYASIREYKTGDILLSNIRPYLKKMWRANWDAGCSSDVLVLRLVTDSVDSRFLYHTLSRDEFFDFVSSKAVGTKMPRGDKRVIASFKIQVPTIAEQEAIADVLAAADSEIAGLEAKKRKYEQIKSGMMHDLLTGKVRVNEECGMGNAEWGMRNGECGMRNEE